MKSRLKTPRYHINTDGYGNLLVIPASGGRHKESLNNLTNGTNHIGELWSWLRDPTSLNKVEE